MTFPEFTVWLAVGMAAAAVLLGAGGIVYVVVDVVRRWGK